MALTILTIFNYMNYINYINITSLTILYSNMVSSISSTQPLVATHPGDLGTLASGSCSGHCRSAPAARAWDICLRKSWSEMDNNRIEQN